MKLTFRTKEMERLYTDLEYRAGLHPQIVRVYRARIQHLKTATDERDIRAFKSLHYEKLKGERKHQRSIRINGQMRIVFELSGEGAGRTIEIVSIEDYH